MRTYQQPGPDARALCIIADAFPGRRAIGFDSLEIILQGGSIHCLPQQEPE
ncbi:MAG: agmatine deiminase family protein [Verrucomicrobiales bacterium]